MPRRALMHKYPLVGRFASFARRRAYLWSFRPAHLRPAFYAGSIVSLMPVMGIQLPIALVLAIMLRANFMVMGGIQFITNPFTAAPIYYVTHQVGKAIIGTAGFKVDPAPVESAVSEAVAEAQPSSPRPRRIRDAQWVKRVGVAVNALIVGAVACGLLLGLALDGMHRLSLRAIRRHHLAHPKHPPDRSPRPAHHAPPAATAKPPSEPTQGTTPPT